MTSRQQAASWLTIIIVTGILVYALRDMLLPFVGGMAVAYFTDPVADWLEKKGFSRTMATTVITVAFFAILLLVLLLVVPLLFGQIIALVSRVPAYLESLGNTIGPYIDSLMAFVETNTADIDPGTVREAAGNARAAAENGAASIESFAIKDYAQQVVKVLSNLFGRVMRGGEALVNFLSLVAITPIVSFYLLMEWDNMVARINGWLPKRHAGHLRRLAREIDATLAGFIRGQGVVCLVLSAYYGIALSLAGLPFGFVIGILSGMLSFIPFVGAIFGAVASIGIALFQFWPDELLRIGIVAAIYVLGQLLEGYVLTPRLVGDRIGLHPVWVMFGVMAGGVLAGFVGMLLALPVSAVIGVVVRFGLERYLASPLYDPANQLADTDTVADD